MWLLCKGCNGRCVMCIEGHSRLKDIQCPYDRAIMMPLSENLEDADKWLRSSFRCTVCGAGYNCYFFNRHTVESCAVPDYCLYNDRIVSWRILV